MSLTNAIVKKLQYRIRYDFRDQANLFNAREYYTKNCLSSPSDSALTLPSDERHYKYINGLKDELYQRVEILLSQTQEKPALNKQIIEHLLAEDCLLTGLVQNGFIFEPNKNKHANAQALLLLEAVKADCNEQDFMNWLRNRIAPYISQAKQFAELKNTITALQQENTQIKDECARLTQENKKLRENKTEPDQEAEKTNEEEHKFLMDEILKITEGQKNAQLQQNNNYRNRLPVFLMFNDSANNTIPPPPGLTRIHR
ncbi:MAG: hypothetical protein V4496_04615 [Pseudomonadota bacterium]